MYFRYNSILMFLFLSAKICIQQQISSLRVTFQYEVQVIINTVKSYHIYCRLFQEPDNLYLLKLFNFFEIPSFSSCHICIQ